MDKNELKSEYTLSENINLKEKIDYNLPKQSANVFFNFMPQLEYLKEKLRLKAFLPRYYEENVDYLELENLEKLAFPMTCFCDIHLNKLIYHTDFYGNYGIGMNKNWGMDKGIQPIHYINKSSKLISDFKYIFSESIKNLKGSSEEIKLYNSYLTTNLLFIKPIIGKMYRNENYSTKNFHDEREWRYIPDFRNVETELKLIIPKKYIASLNKACFSYSEGVKKVSELWLRFDYDNIKYLIVEKDADRVELIEFILEEILETAEIKYKLISKILLLSELREDW